MASESESPKAPQAEVVAISTTNNPARVGPYTDTSLTTRNVSQSAPALNVPPPSGSTTLGDTRPVYAEDQVQEIDQNATNPDAPVPPHSPNSWQIQTTPDGITRSRDPYRNQGLDEYLDNDS